LTEGNGQDREQGGWSFFASLAGYSSRALSGDLAAALTLTAIAVPEQMATARLANLNPSAGFYAFIAGALAFAAFGASRCLSVGADSTITPIFISTLTGLVAGAAATYPALAAVLGLWVGLILVASGMFRLGWIGDLLSAPVTTGFLAGIAVHILASQLPTLLGGPTLEGPLLYRLLVIAKSLPLANPYTLMVGLGVFLAAQAAECFDPRIPGALMALAAASLLVWLFGLESHGVHLLGPVTAALPHFEWPLVDAESAVRVIPLALLVSLVVMVQTAATSRAFAGAGEPANVDRDFLGVGVANLLAGLIGGFAVNASPPRTAVVAETGGRSQLAGLLAAGSMLALLQFGAEALGHIPNAALAGILLFIAMRIIRLSIMVQLYRQSLGEFALLGATFLAIVVLPIAQGVATGIALSLLHGLWSMTRAHTLVFERVTGSSIWWPPDPTAPGETLPGLVVVAFQAPLSFLNAAGFQRGMKEAIDAAQTPVRLVVLEASSLVDIDFTAARVLIDLIDWCEKSSRTLAVARLESLRSQQAFDKFGISARLGANRLFRSVQEAVDRLYPGLAQSASDAPAAARP
jgi:SulP family sulfate permease